MPQFAGQHRKSRGEAGDLATVLADAERKAITEALDRSHGQKSVAARLLGVSRSQFYEKLKRFHIEH